jgi:hypothetical protein
VAVAVLGAGAGGGDVRLILQQLNVLREGGSVGRTLIRATSVGQWLLTPLKTHGGNDDQHVASASSVEITLSRRVNALLPNFAPRRSRAASVFGVLLAVLVGRLPLARDAASSPANRPSEASSSNS